MTPREGITFAPDSENGAKLRYGLTIVPPWKDGGTLHVNFPEHLEYDDADPDNAYVGYSILRHHDKVEYPWNISHDRRTAWYEVGGPHLPGVKVEARLTSNGALAALWMKITNDSDKVLPRVKPLLCFQYRKLKGFPQRQDNFKHTYVVMGGKPKRLVDIRTEKPNPKAMVAYVKGCPQQDCDKFAKGHGGLIAEPIDAAVTAVTALDGKRKVVVAFEPPKSMLSNAVIPCFHADPFFGSLEPGESAEASGAILFTEKELAEAMREMARGEWTRGAGR